MSMEGLTALLWRERRLLELLLFKLDVEQLLLTNGRNRWLAHATDEVTTVLDEIRTVELGHAVESDAVAAGLGLAPGATLAMLAAAAPAPWDTVLGEHRDAFLELTHQIGALADDNRRLLTAAHRSAQETLLAVDRTVQTYDAQGHAGNGVGTATLFDASL
ncbi:flagellar export chaperone FlgN [Sanguibacter sp. HDW7]|uniref:flagellar export chaperone FlgN n=1 Tax=Sanguibacter sp. HDW7 TaxID=2714931 RepID=UPI001408CEB2|nr:flagellar export chaperone FlgN [Sanguibacter sp. HDW7]QIK84317.1 flagellar protein FlgN [Sanguibacter sp. HDW7]